MRIHCGWARERRRDYTTIVNQCIKFDVACSDFSDGGNRSQNMNIAVNLPFIKTLSLLDPRLFIAPPYHYSHSTCTSEIHGRKRAWQRVLLGQHFYQGLWPRFGAYRSSSIPFHRTISRLKIGSSASLDVNLYSRLKSSRTCSSYLRGLGRTPKVRIENIPSSLKDIRRMNSVAFWKWCIRRMFF